MSALNLHYLINNHPTLTFLLIAVLALIAMAGSQAGANANKHPSKPHGANAAEE